MVNIQSNHLKNSRKPNSKPFNLRLHWTIRCIEKPGNGWMVKNSEPKKMRRKMPTWYTNVKSHGESPRFDSQAMKDIIDSYPYQGEKKLRKKPLWISIDDCLCLLQVLPEDLNFCVSSKSFHTFQQHFPSIFTDQDSSFCDRGDGASFSHLHLQCKSHAKHVVILMWMYNFRTKKDVRMAALAFNEMFFVIVIVMETVCACKPPVVVV